MPCKKLPKIRPAKYTGPRRIVAHSVMVPSQYNKAFEGERNDTTIIVANVGIVMSRTRHMPANLASRKADTKVITTSATCTSGIFNMLLSILTWS